MRMIFVTLPVRDLAAATAFYAATGLAGADGPTEAPTGGPYAGREVPAVVGSDVSAGVGIDGDDDGDSVCLTVASNIFVMLVARSRFAELVGAAPGGRLAPPGTTAVTTCLTAESRAQIDAVVARALASGGRPWRPVVDDWPLYGHSFQDPDGHVWELLHVADV